MKMSILAAPDSPPTLSEDRVDPARRHLAARFSCPPGHRESGAPGRQARPGHGTRGRKSPLAAARRGATVFLGQRPPERRQAAMAPEAQGNRPAPPTAHDDHPGAATPARVAGTAVLSRATASMHDRSARRRGGAAIRRPRSCQPLTQGSDCRKPSVRKSTETTSAWNNEALTPSGR